MKLSDAGRVQEVINRRKDMLYILETTHPITVGYERESYPTAFKTDLPTDHIFCITDILMDIALRKAIKEHIEELDKRLLFYGVQINDGDQNGN